MYSQDTQGDYNNTFGIVIGDVTINQNIYKSFAYKELLDQLKKSEKALEKSIPSDIEYRQELLEEISVLHTRINQFKNEVAALHKMFTESTVNTVRFQLAKELFEKGDIHGARNCLDENEIAFEVDYLKTQRKDLESNLQSINEQLIQLSKEYLLKASLSSINFANEGYIQEATELYQKAIATFQSYDSYYQAALFFERIKEYQKAVEYFKFTLEYATDNAALLSLSNYNIGTTYLKFNTQNAKRYLEEAANIIAIAPNLKDATLLSFLANSLHNLSLTSSDNESILLLEKAIGVRKKAALVDSKNFSLLAYTLRVLASKYLTDLSDKTSISKFNFYYEQSVEAMINFIKGDLTSPMPLFQSNSLPDIIVSANVYRFTKGKSAFKKLQNKFQIMLQPYESFILTYDKDNILDIARMYDEYNTAFIKWIDEPYSNQLSEKAVIYYKQSMIIEPLNDDLYYRLALNIHIQSAWAIIKKDKLKGHKLRSEALKYYNKIKSFNDEQNKMRDKLVNQMNVRCQCQECQDFYQNNRLEITN